MTIADYIVEFLYDLGVRKIFLLSGTGSVQLDDAFAKKKGMEYICARHEATAVVMAEAVAKLKNKIGVAVVTTGPGGTNAIAGVTEAWVDSVPVIVISGQVKTDQYIKDRAFGIQGFNIIDNVKRFTKYAAFINDPVTIRYHMERAVYEALSGRPGPVWVDIPMDLQAAVVDIESQKKFVPPSADTDISPSIDQLINLLRESKKPLVSFGRGVKISNCKNELIQFLRNTKIPAISARMGNDVLNYSNENYFGMGGIRGRRAASRIMKKADLLITLGTSNCYTFFGDHDDLLSDKCKLVVVNIDDKIFNRTDLNIHLPIKTDLKKFLSLANARVDNINFKSWLEECSIIKAKYPMVTENMAKIPFHHKL